MEVEIKLHVLPSVPNGPVAFFERLTRLESLAGLPLGPVERIALRDLYFDTADGALAQAGAGLRMRIENGAAFVTLKRSRRREGALTAREEYEEPLTPGQLEEVLRHVRPEISDAPVPFDRFAEGRTAGPLLPVLDTVTERLARTVGDAAVLTLDRVTYPGLTDQSYWDLEVEATERPGGEELLRSSERELQHLAEGHLQPAAMSKLERGVRLRFKQA